MAQHFKYNTGSTINNTTQKGNIAIATSGTYDWGPTSSTGYYPETTPPTGGYTIYYMRSTGGPSIEVATSDAQCVTFLKSFGATGTTINNVLTWASNTADYYVQTGATPSYTIGQSALGGVIAYINGGGSTGTSGLVTAPSGSAGDGYDQWGPAVSISAAYTGGGYNNWRLPTIDELNNLYTNKTTIGGFSTNFTWSITEYNSGYVYYVNFSNGTQSIHPKSYYNNFRAVRSF